MTHKRYTFPAILALGIVVSPASTFAFRSGPPPGRTGSPASGGATCVACHTPSGAAGTGMVQIMGAPAQYTNDALYDLIIRVSDPDQAGAGFQISAEDPVGNHLGGFVITDPVNTKFNDIDPNWVNHTGDGVDDAVTNWAALGNAAEYHVRWQAPSSDAGPVTFWAAGNAINNNFSRSGDHIYTTNVTATHEDLLGSCCDTNGPDQGCTDNVFQSACAGADKSFSTDACANRQCTCIPDCTGRQCGDDGCGGSCGTCDDHVACTDDSCGADGQCTFAPNDSHCDDGLRCNGLETCGSNGCVAGTPVNCNDQIACTVDSCVEPGGTCSHTPSDAICDNGIFCDGAEICTFSGCVSGSAPCASDATCDEVSDTCIPIFVAIPTVSQWGLLVMALLLLIGAKLPSRAAFDFVRTKHNGIRDKSN